jgi:hypothetical protein
VARKLTAALKTQQDGLPLPMERETVGRFLAAWLRDTVRISVRPATFGSYVSIVRCHLVPELGGIPLTRLTPQDVQALMRRRLAEGLSPRRVDYIRGVLRRALNHAMRWGLVGRNAAALVSPPRGRPVEIEPFDPEEARRFLEVIRGDRLEALYTVALAVGLRQGEALGLRWQDVDLRAGTLAVRNSLQRVDGCSDWSSRRRAAAGGPSTCLRSWSPSSTPTAPGSWRSGCAPPSSGRTTAWSLPPTSAARSMRAASPSASSGCWSGPGCGASASTTFATLAPRCSSPRGSRPGWSWRCWATRR